MTKSNKLPINIGHRGHADRLENTLGSFHEACEMGAQMLELDVRLTKDRVPVVFHDNALRRITGLRSGQVSSRTASFLTQLPLAQGARISTLSEVLRELLPRVPINIELKFHNLDYRPLVEAVCDVLDCTKSHREVLVSSFFHQSLEILRKRCPTVVTAPLYGETTGFPHPDELDELRKLSSRWDHRLPFKTAAAVVHYPWIDEALAKAFQERDLTLLTYTVDDPKEMKRLWDLGVDGIITNRPGVLSALLGT